MGNDLFKALRADIPPRLPSRAVIGMGKVGCGVILWYTGDGITMEIDEAGLDRLDDLGLDDAPEGISIWEGDYIWCSNGYYDTDGGYTEPHGKFRVPTDDEWRAIRLGLSPWPEASEEEPEPTDFGPGGAELLDDFVERAKKQTDG